MMRYNKITVGELGVNCYIVYRETGENCFIIDPGDEGKRIIKTIRKMKLIPKGVILTHAHMDHCGGVSGILNEFNIPLMMHEEDLPVLNSGVNLSLAESLGLSIPPPPDNFFENGDKIGVGDVELTVIHTPGHTPGSVCFKAENIIFTGDTLFAGSVGRTDLPGGDFGVLQNSLDILRLFPPETILLPGHGEETTLKKELAFNPFM